MGSVSLNIGDGSARFRRTSFFSSFLHLLMLSSVLTTNLFALYAFTYHSPNPSSSSSSLPLHQIKNLSLISAQVSSILLDISSSERHLHHISRDLSGYSTLDPSLPSLPPELKLFLTRHPLPLGPDSRSKLTHMVSSVSHSCSLSPDLLSQFMSYKPYSLCPSADSHLPTKLISLACDPLPRRRCLSNPNPNPPSFQPELNHMPSVSSRCKNDFPISDVLALGTIRIGFDIAGGAGDLAARMAERNVTIVTSTLDAGGVAAGRGVFPLQLSPANRFPFYDSVFDLVHTMGGLDEGGAAGMGRGRAEALEFLMFDIDRILRAGGLFWLDNYVCVDDERKRMVTSVIERFGYRKLKWVVGEKNDDSMKGKKKKKTMVYLSAVLEKPARG